MTNVSSSSANNAASGNWYLDPVSGFSIPVFSASSNEIWLVSVITFIFALVGFCLYLRVCFIILKYKRSTFSNPFYTVVLYLAIPDCAFLLIQLTAGFFTTVLGYANTPLLFIVINGFFGQICFNSLMSLISVMGINRYIAICHFDKYRTIFGPRQSHLICCSCFLFGPLLPSLAASCQCFSMKADFAWKFLCKSMDEESNLLAKCRKYTVLANETIGGFFTLFIPVINLLSLFNYFVKKCNTQSMLNVPNHRMGKKNVALLFQFVSISAIYVIYLVIYWFHGVNTESNNPFDITLTLLSILNSSVNPYLYAAFSSDIRSKLLKNSNDNPSSVLFVNSRHK